MNKDDFLNLQEEMLTEEEKQYFDAMNERIYREGFEEIKNHKDGNLVE